MFLVVNVSVCFRRGSSQGEAVLVRDRFAVWPLAACMLELWNFCLYLDGLEMFVDSDM